MHRHSNGLAIISGLAIAMTAAACGDAAVAPDGSDVDAGGGVVVAGSCQTTISANCGDPTASSCGALGCCPASTPFACPSNGLCYETQDTAFAGCGGNACYACNPPAGGGSGPGSQCLSPMIWCSLYSVCVNPTCPYWCAGVPGVNGSPCFRTEPTADDINSSLCAVKSAASIHYICN
jgi:hypothetical protein